jgi:DNA helicase-2/ATP-dependent DNA helicase PcrA
MISLNNYKTDYDYVLNKTIKYYGPAGTGKTSRLKYEVYNEIIENNIPPSQIAFLTFTRKEAKHGLKVVVDLGFDVKELLWFRTIHSACFKLLAIEKTNILTEKHKLEFFEKMQIDYAQMSELNLEVILDDMGMSSFGSDFEITINQIKEGNILLSIIDWCRQNHPLVNQPLDFYNDCPIVKNDHLLKNLYERGILVSIEITKDNLIKLSNDYKSFKQEKTLYDFTDLLIEVLEQHLFPPVRVLIIDEAQDLSPLQWAIIDSWVHTILIEKVFLAGDYNQAIYTFAGAKPELFKNYPGKIFWIDITHRLGSIHLDYSRFVIRDPQLQRLKTCANIDCTCGGPNKKSLLLKLTRQNVLQVLIYNFNQIRETFCLFRTNNLMNRFMKSLLLAGIPFKFLAGQSVWTYRTTKTGVNLIALNNIIQKSKQQQFLTLTFDEFSELFKNLKAKESGLLRSLKSDLKRIINNEPPKEHVKNSQKTIDLLKYKNTLKITLSMLEKCFITKEFYEKVFHKELGILPDFLDINPLQYQALKFSKGYLRKEHITIELSTIHRAKGQERQDVFLFTDINKLILENMKGNKMSYEEETRIFYVGVTRVKERLFICENFFSNNLNFPVPNIKINPKDSLLLQELLKPQPNNKSLTTVTKSQLEIDIDTIFYEFENNAVTKQDLYQRLAYPHEIIDEYIEQMIEEGLIYQPRPEYYLKID